MRRRMLFLLLLLTLSPFCFGGAARALEITAVSPATASPGSVVSVSGSAFGENVRIQLGDRLVRPDAVRENRLLFTVPPMDEGEYALSLRSGDTVSDRSFLLRIVTPAPRITSLSPRNIDICSSSGEREVTVNGEHFQPGASVLLDGKAIPHSQASEGMIAFNLPVLEAGVYGIQVVNPDDRTSLPQSIYFNSVPEITSVSQGENFVNSYQLIIEGKNFFFNSALVVTEYPGDLTGLPPNQRVIVGRSETGSGTEALPDRTQSDSLRYVDCRTLIYKRFPYSMQEKELTLQVINPDGKESSTYTLSAP